MDSSAVDSQIFTAASATISDIDLNSSDWHFSIPGLCKVNPVALLYLIRRRLSPVGAIQVPLDPVCSFVRVYLSSQTGNK